MQGLGITVFGMAYMFVHDGLVHRRFPVGPIANVPYFRRVAAAHQVSVLFLSSVLYMIIDILMSLAPSRGEDLLLSGLEF